MMNRNLSRRSEQDQVIKPSAAAGRRRALEDITNVTGEDTRDNAPKRTTQQSASASERVREADILPPVVPMQVVAEERTYMQRPSDDIDARDASNPVLATTYVNEMYVHYGETERKFSVNSAYMANQPYINERMRSILIDWLVEVHLKFKMVPETLFLTTNIIDRYLELKQVRRSKLQLVGVAALQVAAKYEEIYPPSLKDLVYITDHAYTNKEIVEMESDIINTLQFQFMVPTIHTFLCRYLKAAHADRTMVQLACYLAERSLQEYSTLRFLPSVIAASAVLVARKSLRRHPWSPTLLQYTGYDEPDLAQCTEDMRAFLTNAASQQQAVQRKYSSPRFGGVATTSLMF